MDFSGQRDFAVRLGSQLAGEPGNLFIGSLSVWTALALLVPGARGQTKQNLASVLGLPVEDKEEAWIAAVRELTASLTEGKATNPEPQEDRRWFRRPKTERKPSSLIVANAIWLQEGFPIEANYLERVIEGFLAQIESLDFAGHPAEACETINRWADEKTKGKIPEVLSPREVGGLTRLILSNATYFKDDWAVPFKARATRTKPFYRLNDSRVRIPMMHLEDHMIYAENRNYQAVELAYSREGLSMVVVLPKDIRLFEADLTPESFAGLTDSLQYPQLVHLDLPKWEIENDMMLREPLQAMGLADLFGSTADLSGISAEPEFFVSEVKHVTYVQVDEQGTEAAAVTVVVAVTASPQPSAPPRPKIMIVDRPFWFFIRDRKSGCLLFSGRIEDPS